MSLFGLIGYPVSHSGSKQYFDHRFNEPHPGPHSYRLFPLEKISRFPGLPAQHPELTGLNVTSPYKEQIIPFLDELDKDARAIGAVNTIHITRKAGKRVLKGFNTDAGGFLATLNLTGFDRALILGTGGAARAVGFVLNKNGIRVLYVSRIKKGADIVSYKDVTPSLISEYRLIIQATPVGMFPETEACPDIPYRSLTETHLLYDLIYYPAETRFLKMGIRQGSACMNGMNLLHQQAELSYKIWGLC
jgi:shikimate dehydrogenase